MDHFEDLPTEMCEEIFGYVGTNELIRLTMVCKRFNAIIGNSMNLMGRIVLKINSDSIKEQNVVSLLKSTRKYQNLTVEGGRLSAYQYGLATDIGNICGNIKKVTFKPQPDSHMLFFPDALAKEILIKSPEIESLEWIGATSCRSHNLTDFQAKLPNLKHLRVEDCNFDPCFIKNFDAITELVSFRLDKVYSVNCNLAEFILRQEKLKHLELANLFFEDSIDYFLSNFKIQLESLSVKFNVRNYEKIIKLLDTQTKLKELAVLPGSNVDPFIDESSLLESVLNKTTVKKLTINYSRENFEEQVYRGHLCGLVTELKVIFLRKAGGAGLRQIEQLLNIMPNVKTLHFSTNPHNDKGTFDELDIQFLNQYQNLENLYVGVTSSPTIVKFLELKNLKRFAVDSYYRLNAQLSQATKIMTGVVWLPFLRRHPQLVELNVSNLLLSKYLWKYIDRDHPALKIVNLDVNNIRCESECNNLTNRHLQIIAESEKFRLKHQVKTLDSFKLSIVSKQKTISQKIKMMPKHSGRFEEKIRIKSDFQVSISSEIFW
jgi:hypothetical protein